MFYYLLFLALFFTSAVFLLYILPPKEKIVHKNENESYISRDIVIENEKHDFRKNNIIKNEQQHIIRRENRIRSKKQCNVRRKNRIQNDHMWNTGNFIDLGANNGDSLVWFYNLHMPNLKYFVPYPKIESNITKNFNTYIFEANPNLCNKIRETVKFIKSHTQLVNFKIYCPVIVSTYEGREKMTIDNNDYASSKYYETNGVTNRDRKVYMVPVMNFTKFLSENIPPYDFNVMKFDVEGEEDYIIPELMKTKLLSKFDVLYSEFHLGGINNPLKEKTKYIFEDFLKYTKENGIETYEEEKISEDQMKVYNKIYKDLMKCK